MYGNGIHILLWPGRSVFLVGYPWCSFCFAPCSSFISQCIQKLTDLVRIARTQTFTELGYTYTFEPNNKIKTFTFHSNASNCSTCCTFYTHRIDIHVFSLFFLVFFLFQSFFLCCPVFWNMRLYVFQRFSTCCCCCCYCFGFLSLFSFHLMY